MFQNLRKSLQGVEADPPDPAYLRALSKRVTYNSRVFDQGCQEAARVEADERFPEAAGILARIRDRGESLQRTQDDARWRPIVVRYQQCMRKRGYLADNYFTPGQDIMRGLLSRVSSKTSDSEITKLEKEAIRVGRAIDACSKSVHPEVEELRGVLLSERSAGVR